MLSQGVCASSLSPRTESQEDERTVHDACVFSPAPLLTTLGKRPVKLQAEGQLLQGRRGPVLALPEALTPSATLSSPPCRVVTVVSGF